MLFFLIFLIIVLEHFLYWSVPYNHRKTWALIPLSGFILYYKYKMTWRFGIRKKIITRGDGEVYLIRYTIFTFFTLFSIKLHKIILSDDACLHDHPWAFISLILRRGYIEEHYGVPMKIIKEYGGDVTSVELKDYIVSKRYRAGSLLYRPANYTHRLIILGKPAWTLVFTFKKIRRWGFWTRLGWVHWRLYKQDNSCE